MTFCLFSKTRRFLVNLISLGGNLLYLPNLWSFSFSGHLLSISSFTISNRERYVAFTFTFGTKYMKLLWSCFQGLSQMWIFQPTTPPPQDIEFLKKKLFPASISCYSHPFTGRLYDPPMLSFCLPEFTKKVITCGEQCCMEIKQMWLHAFTTLMSVSVLTVEAEDGDISSSTKHWFWLARVQTQS